MTHDELLCLSTCTIFYLLFYIFVSFLLHLLTVLCLVWIASDWNSTFTLAILSMYLYLHSYVQCTMYSDQTLKRNKVRKDIQTITTWKQYRRHGCFLTIIGYIYIWFYVFGDNLKFIWKSLVNITVRHVSHEHLSG